MQRYNIDGNSMADHLSRYLITMVTLAVLEWSSHNLYDIVWETETDPEAAELLERKQGEKKKTGYYESRAVLLC